MIEDITRCGATEIKWHDSDFASRNGTDPLETYDSFEN